MSQKGPLEVVWCVGGGYRGDIRLRGGLWLGCEDAGQNNKSVICTI